MTAAGRGRTLLLAALVATQLAGGAACRRQRLAGHRDGAAVIVVAATPGPDAGPVVSEREPNDTLAAAQLLVLSGDPLSVAVTGSLTGAGKRRDADLFKLVVPPSGLGATDADPRAISVDAGPPIPSRRLVVTLEPDGLLSPLLQLLDGTGGILVNSRGVSGERDGLSNAGVVPGAIYLIRVQAAGPSKLAAGDAGAPVGGYRLVVRLLDFEVGDEREPNDGIATAHVLAGAQTRPEIAGYLGWRRDEDWFRLPLDNLPAGNLLDFELEAVESVGASIVVHDARGAEFAIARGRRGERAALRSVVVPATASPAAGSDRERFCYVVVRADSGRNLDQRYVLRVSPVAAEEGKEREPNDDPTRAVAVTDGTWIGFLSVDDVDLFRYAPAASRSVEVTIMPPPRINVELELIAERDRRVIARADIAGRGQEERLVATIGPGPVLVRVAVSKGQGNVDEPYQLKIAGRVLDAGQGP